MSTITGTRPPPELRIVRRRTIDVDQDAAGLVAAATAPQTKKSAPPKWLGIALALVILGAALVLLWPSN